MNTDILPSFSKLVSEEVFLSSKDQLLELQHLYVISNNLEVFHYQKTAGGSNFLKMKGWSNAPLPNSVKNLPSTLEETFHHLPGGKVPLNLLSQILSFFTKIANGTRDEAMAHILWDTLEKKYVVGIPTQTVSGAAANYKFDDILPHHILVVDIHSHHYMSPFWSGTDDTDDSRGVWISGVFGSMGSNPTCNWRYTSLGNFRPMIHDDIFDTPYSEISFKEQYPEEWNTKVTLRPKSELGGGYNPLRAGIRGILDELDPMVDGFRSPTYPGGWHYGSRWVPEDEDIPKDPYRNRQTVGYTPNRYLGRVNKDDLSYAEYEDISYSLDTLSSSLTYKRARDAVAGSNLKPLMYKVASQILVTLPIEDAMKVITRVLEIRGHEIDKVTTVRKQKFAEKIKSVVYKLLGW